MGQSPVISVGQKQVPKDVSSYVRLGPPGGHRRLVQEIIVIVIAGAIILGKHSGLVVWPGPYDRAEGLLVLQ